MQASIAALLLALILLPAAPAAAQTRTGDGTLLAPVPPMGWMSWNFFADKINEKDLMEMADAINEQNDGAYHYVYDRSSVRQKRDPKEIGISSVRGGSIVGDHEVLFCGPDEVITLKHTAYSRSIFANGAINAAVYLAKKEPGLYNMGDLIASI